MKTFPRILIITHRWAALGVGVILFATACSGATLVFEGAIDRALHPALWRVRPSGAPLPIDTLVARVEAVLPESSVNSVVPTLAPRRAWIMHAGAQTVFVDPYTGEINGLRTPAEAQATLARRLHVLHVELFGGTVGREVVGAATIVGLFLIVSGLFLWWPDKRMRVQTKASWKRINFDLHHTLGVLTSLILIVITASGLVIHYDALAGAIKSLDATEPPAVPAQPAATANPQRPSYDDFSRTAQRALPGAEVRLVSIGNARTPAVVGMRFPTDRTPGGRSRVYIDRNTGRATDGEPVGGAPLNDGQAQWQDGVVCRALTLKCRVLYTLGHLDP